MPPKVALITGQDALLDSFKLKERYETKFRAVARKVLSTNAKITSGVNSSALKAIGRSPTAPSLRA